MKSTTLFSIFALMLIFSACGQNYDTPYYEDAYYQDAYYQDESAEGGYGEPTQVAYRPNADEPTTTRTRYNGGDEKIVMRNLKDGKTGMVSGQIPLPASWEFKGNKIVGPNGIECQEYPGGALYQLLNIDQVIAQHLQPRLQQVGAQVLGTIDLPEIARNDQRMMSNYWSAMPDQKMHYAKGIEVKGTDGHLGLVIVHLMHSRSQYGNMGFYYLHGVSAQPQAYESAKKAYIYALANQTQNPEYIAHYNRQEQAKSNASWATHNAKMRTNQANFDSWQKTQQNLSDISDIQHEGWKKRNAISDRMHDNTIDGIWERNTVNDPYSGQQTKVESGYKYYYMNSFGEYIGSNDEFWNPAQDPNYNGIDWRRVENPNGY